ncbi:hypothetical protein T4B_14694 [Trichinella pseudospiralis]|uniref:Uncharacterized protein n=1 Tax=Trichinella pseudospiralis TaxID=6337 RepID=A0A0V1JBV3_TRIPS|nr:hypothetical protein T4B_14694 [Trichinella pseudospiralis]KRZ45698.1 hypothetical protein T4C_1634 [Trichinella pseudospiralis]
MLRHVPRMIRCCIKQKKNTLKRRAREETKPVPQIYKEECGSASTSLETAEAGPNGFPHCQQLEIPAHWRMNVYWSWLDILFGVWMEHFKLFLNGTSRCSLFMSLKKPQTVICNFETVSSLQCRDRFLGSTSKAAACLPLPEAPAAVELLGRNVTGPIAALFDYFQRKWMNPNRLPLWNVYNVEICTNNHLEGWHLKMNRQAGINGNVDSASDIRARYSQ